MLAFISFPIPVTMIVFETLWREISFCLGISVQRGDFYNRLDDKVEMENFS